MCNAEVKYFCTLIVAKSVTAIMHEYIVESIAENQKIIMSTNSMINKDNDQETCLISQPSKLLAFVVTQKCLKELFPKFNNPTHYDFITIPLLKLTLKDWIINPFHWIYINSC